MAGGASAAVAPEANVRAQGAAPPPMIVLGEEEISDVSLATFYVLDRQNGTSHLGDAVKLARACGGCRGCGGCAARGCGGCAARGCAAVRAGCAVRSCAVGCRSCRACRGCGCGVGFVGCAGCVGCGGGCGGPCWQWNGWTWVPVC
jgi:hypothetical protein